MKNFILLLGLMLFAGMATGQALKVASNGNVGIGISNPATSLDVVDDARVRGNLLEVGRDAGSLTTSLRVGFGRSADGVAAFDLIGDASNFNAFGFRFQRATNGQTTMVHQGVRDFVIRNNDAADFAIWTNGTQRFTIEDNGFIGLGIANPQAVLHVNGDIIATGTITPSDDRLKNVLKSDNMPGLDQVLKMEVVRFAYNGAGGVAANDAQLGVIAQNIQEIAPELVQDFKYVEEDEDNNVVLEETYLSIKDSEFKYVLINAIQDQQAIIADLQAQIEELRSSVAITDGASNDVELVDVAQSTLGQNSPNPYNEGTVISYSVADNATSAKMNFYSLTGQLIKSVTLQNGAGKVNVSADELPSGTYTYSLEVDGALISNKKMVKMR